MSTASQQPAFDCDADGAVLPTLRNAAIVKELFQTHKTMDEVQAILEDDGMSYFMASLFDPRKKNVVFHTPERALKVKEQADLINRLDREWLAKKGKTNTTNNINSLTNKSMESKSVVKQEGKNMSYGKLLIIMLVVGGVFNAIIAPMIQPHSLSSAAAFFITVAAPFIYGTVTLAVFLLWVRGLIKRRSITK